MRVASAAESSDEIYGFERLAGTSANGLPASNGNWTVILFQYPMTILYDPARKKEPSATFNAEREACLKFFEKWSEPNQVEFVENLLARMCHYQHGHINSYLKPMLQRDFISLLPSEYRFFSQKKTKTKRRRTSIFGI